MFYSKDILQKRGGKFGVIWIAATRASDLTKRDYSAVNVARTCDEIINHLTSGTRYDRGRFPRFSLYLSAQLMFGVTLVHGKHTEYLYSDAMTLQSKFIPKRRVAPGGLLIIGTKDIDMKTSTRPTEALRLEDPLDMYRPGLVELDPEFGRLNIPEDMIEPAFLPIENIIHFPLAPPTPEWWPGRGKDTRKPRSPHSPGSPPDYDPNQVKDKKDISLPPEIDWPSPDQVPYKGEDLQPPKLGDILSNSLTSSESEEFFPPEKGPSPSTEQPGTPPMEPPSRKRPETEKRGDPAPKKQKPEKRKEPSDPRGPEAKQDLPREDKPPMEESPPTPDHRLPEPRTSPQSELELSPIPEADLRTPPRPPRPGRGPMIDRDTQLSREEVRNNLAHPEQTLAPLVHANPKLHPTADQLFRQPCRRVHNPDLLRLWQRNTFPVPPGHPLAHIIPSSTSSEEDSPEGRRGSDESRETLRGSDTGNDRSPKRPRMDESGESVRLRDTSSMSEGGSDHGPMPRPMDIPRRPTDLGPVPYDTIPEEYGPEPDIPDPGQIPPEEEPQVPPQQVTPPQVTPPQVTPQPEKAPTSDHETLSSKESLCEPPPSDQVPFTRLHPSRSKVSREDLNRALAGKLVDYDSTTFDTLAPSEQFDRATAACYLYICLDLHKEQKIQLYQDMPYGDIVIERGPRFTVMQTEAFKD